MRKARRKIEQWRFASKFLLGAAGFLSLVLFSATFTSAQDSEQDSLRTSKLEGIYQFRPTNEDPAIAGNERRFWRRDFEALQDAVSRLDVVMLVDASRSMKRTDPDRLRDEGLMLLTHFLGPEDRVAVLSFGKNVRFVLDFTPVNEETRSGIGRAIAGIEATEGFTDLQLPIEAANLLIEQRARPNVPRVVLLLSDGKMDPHPSRGREVELVNFTVNKSIPKLLRLGGVLYTLGVSAESDIELLSYLAKKGGGKGWLAINPGDINDKIVSLGSAMKRPQLSFDHAEGLMISDSMLSASIIVLHEGRIEDTAIVDPIGTTFTPQILRESMAWHAGSHVDVLRVPDPQQGMWKTVGFSNSKSFAILDTNVFLQTHATKQFLMAGDTVLLQAEVLLDGKPKRIDLEKDFVTYKVINDDTDEVVIEGELNDVGADGDPKAGDFILGGTVKIDEIGSYHVVVAANFGHGDQSYHREQQISLEVEAGMIGLEYLPSDTVLEIPERFRVNFTEEASDLKRTTLKIFARSTESDESLVATVRSPKISDNQFYFSPSPLPVGEYGVYVKLEGVDARRQKVHAYSQTLPFARKKLIVRPAPLSPSEILSQDTNWLPDVTASGIGLLWLILLGSLAYRLTFFSKAMNLETEPFVLPGHTAAIVAKLKGTAAPEPTRTVTEKDRSVFALVEDALASEVEAESEDETPEESKSDDSAKGEDSEGEKEQKQEGDAKSSDENDADAEVASDDSSSKDGETSAEEKDSSELEKESKKAQNESDESTEDDLKSEPSTEEKK